MIRGLLCEMAVYEESEVFQMNPVASVSTKDVINLEGEGLRKFVFEYINSSNTNPQVNINEHDIGVVISHYVSYRPLYKAALLALPNVMAANIVTKAWSRKTGNKVKSVKSQDNRLSGMVSAPILIDSTKYLCGVTLKKSSKRVVPYAIILKDSNGKPVEREKMDGTISNAPHRSNEPTTSGDARLDKAPTSHDTITSSTIENNPNQERFNDNQENYGIKDSINPRYNILKENNQINSNKNMNRNRKNVVRLTESKLRKMIKESVSQILTEMIDEGQGARELWGHLRDTTNDVPRYERDEKQRNQSNASLKDYIKTGSWVGNEDNDLIGYDWDGNAVHKDTSKNFYRGSQPNYPDIKPINNSTWGKIGRAAAGTAIRLMTPRRTINRIGNQITNKIRPKA